MSSPLIFSGSLAPYKMFILGGGAAYLAYAGYLPGIGGVGQMGAAAEWGIGVYVLEPKIEGFLGVTL